VSEDPEQVLGLIQPKGSRFLSVGLRRPRFEADHPRARLRIPGAISPLQTTVS